jgi:hypothetical protein
METTNNNRAIEDPVRPLPLWYSTMSGPLLWAFYHSVVYALGSDACQKGYLVESTIIGINALVFVLALITIAILGLMALGGVIAYRNWSRLKDENEPGVGFPERNRFSFMSFVGMGFNALFGASVLVTFLPTFFLNPCM